MAISYLFVSDFCLLPVINGKTNSHFMKNMKVTLGSGGGGPFCDFAHSLIVFNSYLT